MDPFIVIVQMGIMAAFLLSVASWMGRFHQAFEICSHFRFQYFLVSLIGTCIFILRRDWPWTALGTLTTAINAVETIPWLVPIPSKTGGVHRLSVRLLLSNVLYTNRQHGALTDLVHRRDPDILVLQEINPRWLSALAPLKAHYPYVVSFPFLTAFDLAVFSRLPLDKAEVVCLGKPEAPCLSMQVKIGHKNVSLLTTHLTSPGWGQDFHARNRQLAEMGEILKNIPKPTIVIGDLNITMWSPYYRRLIQETQLMNTRKGRGIFPSWPTFFPVIKIPLDHCLISKALKTVSVDTEAVEGSDHSALIVDLSL